MKRMKNHGTKIDRERKTRKGFLDERIREARGKLPASTDTVYADIVDRKTELNAM